MKMVRAQRFFLSKAFGSAFWQQHIEELAKKCMSAADADAFFQTDSEDAQQFLENRKKAVMYWVVFPKQYCKFFGKKWTGWYGRPTEKLPLLCDQ
jgi:hypothetical protein